MKNRVKGELRGRLYMDRENFIWFQPERRRHVVLVAYKVGQSAELGYRIEKSIRESSFRYIKSSTPENHYPRASL